MFDFEKEYIVTFENQIIGKFRCDLVVEGKVIVELKSVTGFQPKLFQNQLISYLKASKIKTGLLINFGNTSCEVKRISV
ncbi:GxxExxY protein [Pedobacter sp. UYP30]